MQIHIQCDDEAVVPQTATPGSAGFDLSALEDAVIPAQGRALVKTGIRVALPLGYEMQIRSRSGLALKEGIVVLNAPGTIDSDYRGDIGVILFNTTDKDFEVNKGDRIAQAVIAAHVQAHLVRVASLDETARGTGGFGSTGV